MTIRETGPPAYGQHTPRVTVYQGPDRFTIETHCEPDHYQVVINGQDFSGPILSEVVKTILEVFSRAA